MKKLFSIALLLLTVNCQAEDNFFKSSINWIKQSLPDSTRVEFNKSKIKFTGCKQREYDLSLYQPINSALSLEGGISYATGKLNWGIHTQKISLKRYSFVPRLKVNNRVSFGAGVIYQPSPEFRTSIGEDFDLPKSQILLINGRFRGMRDTHEIEVELSSHRWDATKQFGVLFENGLTDNKLTVSYQAFF